MKLWISGMTQFLAERRYLYGVYLWVLHSHHIFMVLVLTTVTGIIIQFLMREVQKKCDRPGGLKYIQIALRINLLAYIIPFVYLVLRAQTIRIEPGEDIWFYYVYNNRGFDSSPQIHSVTFLIVQIWLVGFLISSFRFLLTRKNIKILLLKGTKAEESLYGEMTQWKNRMEIRDQIELVMFSGIPTSFTIGLYKKIICLPAGKEKNDYTLMLIHELLHIKHGDMFWGCLMSFASAVQWFNPFCRHLLSNMDRWDEACVDEEVQQCQVNLGAYMKLLLMQALDWRNAVSFQTNGMRTMSQKGSGIKERISRMDHHRAIDSINKTKAIRGTVTLAAAGIVFSLISGSLLVEAKGRWVEATEEAHKMEMNGRDLDVYVEKTMSVEELDSYVITVDESIDLAADSSGSINWQLNGFQAMETGSVYLSAGSEIEVVAFASPTDKTVKIAVKRGANEYSYINGNAAIYHTFPITVSGTYSIAAFNPNATAVTLTGGYYIR